MRSLPAHRKAHPLLVSWDVDGTLYAVGPMLRKALGRALQRCRSGYSLQTCREIRELCRYHLWFEKVRTAGGLFQPSSLPFSIRRFMDLQKEWYADAIASCGLREGLPEVLGSMQRLHLPCVVFSDYQADYKLAALGLESAFEARYEGVHLGALKPARDVFLRMASDFGIRPDRILHIGDRFDTDGGSAAAAGCSSLIYGRDFESYLDFPETLH